jgi:hypothetical protein
MNVADAYYFFFKKNINRGGQIITPATVNGLNRGGQVKAPTAVNVFTAAGAKARHGEVTIYRDLCTMAEPFARCGKRIVPTTVKVPAVVLYVFPCWPQVRSVSLCFSCLLTGVAALFAQGICPPLPGPIFDSALLMSYCLIMNL